jgi:hypothetical protein
MPSVHANNRLTRKKCLRSAILISFLIVAAVQAGMGYLHLETLGLVESQQTIITEYHNAAGEAEKRRVFSELPLSSTAVLTVDAMDARVSAYSKSLKTRNTTIYVNWGVLGVLCLLQFGVSCIVLIHDARSRGNDQSGGENAQQQNAGDTEASDARFAYAIMYVSDRSVSTLTTLGILGTFLGLVTGLGSMSFGNGARIGLEPLFSSLAVSFFSSICGIALGLFTRVAQQVFLGRPGRIENLEITLERMQKTAEKNVSVIETLKLDIAGRIITVVSDTIKETYKKHFERLSDVSRHLDAVAHNANLLTIKLAEYAEQLEKIKAQYEDGVELFNKLNVQHEKSNDLYKSTNNLIGNLDGHIEHMKSVLDVSNEPLSEIATTLRTFRASIGKSTLAVDGYWSGLRKAINRMDQFVSGDRAFCLQAHSELGNRLTALNNELQQLRDLIENARTE